MQLADGYPRKTLRGRLSLLASLLRQQRGAAVTPSIPHREFEPEQETLAMAKHAKQAPAPSNKLGESDYDNMYGSAYLSPADIKKPTRTAIEEIDKEVFDRQDHRSEAKLW